jgi:4-hydroxy-3-polyprenylbenzoate decarboxylase
MLTSLTAATAIHDLRSALQFLEQQAGQLIQTQVEVDPHAELAGVYRHVGAGGTVMRPTRTGPAMLFNTIKGHPGARVCIGLLAARKRVALLLGSTPERLGFHLLEAVQHPIEPVLVPEGSAPCQEVVHRATDQGFDLRRLVPATTNTPEDAGPFITMGLCYGADPETGQEDVTIHRLCVQGPDTLSMYFTPGRHLDAFRIKAEQAGQPQPISISIGLDPAVYLAACFEPPTTPLGFNELTIAGALRGRPVELVQCLTVKAKALASAEIVIEGELMPDLRVAEDQNSGTGKAMPEFPGYNGPAHPSLPVIRVTAVTHRVNPIMQTCIGPSEEHVSLAGIPTEASILSMVNRALPGFLKNVYAHPSGGGKLLAVLQVIKRIAPDEGRQRQAALLAFAAFSELKHVILVDDDVDPFDSNDVLWAMTTRFQADADVIAIPGVRCHALDPSQFPGMSPSIRDRGISCKTIFDCTVPVELRQKFQRAQFMDVDYERFLKG